MDKLILYHGSSQIVERPIYGQGKLYNDYGQGFYCTEHLELAKEWACTQDMDGYANKYEIELEGLKILNLSSEGYCSLHWLAILMKYRKIRLSTPIMARGAMWLQEHFGIDTDQYDMVVGYRADDSYFSFARAFVSNEISLKQLNYALELGTLGEQYVLKSSKAFERIRFVSSEMCDNSIYYARRKARDDEARVAYLAELDKDDIDGIYMRDVIREEMKANDARLQ